MITWSAYWRLMRLDKPVGVLLLWFPTAWALWLANPNNPSFKLCCLFFIGTILMRAAGCVVNDIADRDIDKYVERTQSRPLTSGEISLTGAVINLLILLLGTLSLLIYLPLSCFYYALIALGTTILYPFCKRFLQAPQLILGLAFSMGIPMAYSASSASLNKDFLLLFLINFAWIVAYDTMYAMADKKDDLKLGVKSTAIYFGDYDRIIIAVLQCLVHGIWFYWAWINKVSFSFYYFWALALGILIYQQCLIKDRIPNRCLKGFLVSAYYGALMWAALLWQRPLF